MELFLENDTTGCMRLWTQADFMLQQKRFEVRKALAKVRSSAKAS